MGSKYIINCFQFMTFRWKSIQVVTQPYKPSPLFTVGLLEIMLNNFPRVFTLWDSKKFIQFYYYKCV